MSRARIIQATEILPAPIPKAKNFKNLSGQFFGGVSVVCYAGSQNQTSMWYCRCVCGNFFIAMSSNLQRGNTTSCGCFHSQRCSEAHKTHGFTNKQRESGYGCWASMKQRCLDPNSISYPHYGARGIKICDRWLESFKNFYADMGPRPSLKHSIERKNNDGNYEPQNCVWATGLEQAFTKSNVIHVMFEGKKVVLAEAIRKSGLTNGCVYARVERGWNPQDAIDTPLMRRKRNGNNF
jgi:hypothetical protein